MGITKTPFISRETKEICIQETFLSYLWCMCYELLLLVDSLTFEKEYQQDTAKKLIVYALSLKDKYTDWDKTSLANPERYEENQSELIHKVNGIFVHASNFILCHEFYHVSCGHIDQFIKPIRPNNEEERDFETEADREAIKIMMSGKTKVTEDTIKISIAIALCSMLFLSNSVKKEKHSDTDSRILDALDPLEIEKMGPMDNSLHY